MRERRHDILDRGLRGEFDRRVAKAEPLGAQPHLGDGFLAGDVDRAMTVARVIRRNFDQQGRFADARIAAKKQHRTAHQTRRR